MRQRRGPHERLCHSHRSRRPRLQHQGLLLNPMSGGGRARLVRLRPVAVAEWALSSRRPGRSTSRASPASTSAGPCARSAWAASSARSPRCSGPGRRTGGRKTDRRDAEFLARLLATSATSRRWGPDDRTEAARDLSRALADARDDLQRAKQRMSGSSLRHGHVFDETTPTGRRRGSWTRAYWEWADAISFAEPTTRRPTSTTATACGALPEARDALARRVAGSAGRPGVEAGRRRAQVRQGTTSPLPFLSLPARPATSRFRTAPEFASWCGLAPRSTRAARPRRGRITQARATPTRARPSSRRPGTCRASSREPAPLAPGRRSRRRWGGTRRSATAGPGPQGG